MLASLPRLSELDGLAVSLEERAAALAMWADLEGLDDDVDDDEPTDERARESTGSMMRTTPSLRNNRWVE